MSEKKQSSQLSLFKPSTVVSKESGIKQLYEQLENFFSWYLFIRKTSSPSEGYQDLQYIMQMSKHGTLSQSEIQSALHALAFLEESLYEGTKTISQIPEEIARILNRLIEKPKNRLVKQITQIEMLVHSKMDTDNPSSQAMVNQIIDKLKKQITPNTPDIKAKEISRVLDKALQSKSKKQEFDLKHLITIINREITT